MRRHSITERTWLEVEELPDGVDGVLHVLAPEGHVTVPSVDVFLGIELVLQRACEGSPEALRTYSRIVHQLRRSERDDAQAAELAAALCRSGLGTGAEPEIEGKPGGRSS